MNNIVADLLDLFPDTVEVTAITRNGLGTETVGATTPYPAFIYGQTELVKDESGKVVKSKVTAIIAATGLKVEDRYTLPARFQPRQPRAIHVDRATDENGAHHETVYF